MLDFDTLNVQIAHWTEKHRDAAGAAWGRAGFASHEAMDLAFGLGFPSVRWVTADVDDSARQIEAATRYAGLNYRLAWPENVAVPVMRAWCCPRGQDPPPSSGPISSDELGELVARIIDPTRLRLDMYEAEDCLFLLEALHGPELVIEHALDALEGLSDDAWAIFGTRAATAGHALFQLGLMALRLSPERWETTRARLESLWTHHCDSNPDAWRTKRLDALLHGREGIERSSPKDARYFLMWHEDNASLPGVFAATAKEDSVIYTARLAFLAGPAVYVAARSSWASGKSRAAHAWMFDTVREISGDGAFRLVVELATTSKAKKHAEKYFRASTRARERLEEASAIGGELGKLATALEERLG